MPPQISDSEFRELYLDFPIAACVIGRDGRYIANNNELAVLLGIPGTDLAGQPVVDYFGTPAQVNVVRDFAAFDVGLTIPNHEFVARGRVFLAASRPVRQVPNGPVVAIHVVLIDITDRKELENRLELANRQLSEANHKLTEAARTDALTGLWNRHALEELLPWEINRSLREKSPLSVLLADIDHFKRYNDCYGHLAGDEALRAVAKAMAGTLSRTTDIVARYGGEEFLVVLPSTDAAGAMAVAQRLQKAIAGCAVTHEAGPFRQLTVSIGVATLPLTASPDQATADIRAKLIDDADHALYAVKQQGRDGVKLYQPSDHLVPR